VPRATSALNVLQRIGGSLGTALLAVVLQHELAARLGGTAGGGGGTLRRLPEEMRARIGEPLAAAFAHTFWWAVALGLVGVAPAILLAVTQRRAPGHEAGQAVAEAVEAA
jgi:hypothetical protein